MLYLDKFEDFKLEAFEEIVSPPILNSTCYIEENSKDEGQFEIGFKKTKPWGMVL